MASSAQSPPSLIKAPAEAKISLEDIVRWMMGKPLQFEPGSRFAYSNLGFMVLGRVSWMRSDKVTFVAIFNSNPTGFLDEMSSALHTLSGSFLRNKFPTIDLFSATLSYDAWKARHFTPAELDQTGISGDLADPDGDGRPNLVEYAFHRNPRVPEFEPDLQPAGLSGSAAGSDDISFRRLLLGHELDYRVEVSSDLKNWSALDHATSPQILNADGSVQITVRPAQSAEPAAARFYRVRVVLLPHQSEPL